MKTITINTIGLSNAVTTANTFTSKEGEFAGKIVLVGTNGKLMVKASDINQTIIFRDIGFVSSDLTDSDFPAFSIDGKKLQAVLKAAKNDEIMMNLLEDKIEIKSGRSKIKIETMVKTQSIDIAIGSGDSFDVSSHIGSFERVLHAIDMNNPKFELNGALLQVKDGMFNIVATDTRRLSVISSQTDIDDMEIIIPKVGVQTIVKLFSKTNVSAEIDSSSISVHSDTLSYQTKLTNGKFPEWSRIMPKSFSQKITLNKSLMISLLKEASVFENNLLMKIEHGEIVMKDESMNTKVSEVFDNQEASIKLGVNAKHLLDFMVSTDEEEVVFNYADLNLPIMLSSGEQQREIMMPVMDIIEKDDEVQVDERIAA